MTIKGRTRSPYFEARWPPVLAVLAVLLLAAILPGRISLFPAWVPYVLGVAVLLARLFGLDQPVRYGLVLLAMVAGAESIPLLTMNAKGNVGLAVGLLVTSMVINIFYLPFMLSIFLKDVHIDKIPLLVRLGLTVALPVLIGLVVKAVNDKATTFLAKYVRRIANLAMIGSAPSRESCAGWTKNGAESGAAREIWNDKEL